MNTTATTRKGKRRLNDFYATPAWATQELLLRMPWIQGRGNGQLYAQSKFHDSFTEFSFANRIPV